MRPLLTDQYQLTMAYAYFYAGRHEEKACFDMFFRNNPFKGEFTVFAGLSEALRFVSDFNYTDNEIEYICSQLPRCTSEFKHWLKHLDCSEVKIYSHIEGNLVFPRVPMMRVEGPLGICQLLETTLLNLVSYPSLVATNAARMRLAAGENKSLIEFGMRRAQGPDGAVSAARYSYLGGFDGSSDMMAGRLFDIPVSGTQAHSYISSFAKLADLKNKSIKDSQGNRHDFLESVMKYRAELAFDGTNEGELTAFIAYAQAFPNGFLALVDTYDTLDSGVPNFLCVALALNEIGYDPIGIRLDSGDLSHLSKETRRMFIETGKSYELDFSNLKIVASNEINEETLRSLADQGHEIDIFGIGTHLVTCQNDPSLGCVYKLVEINSEARIKLSESIAKMTLPSKKDGYRLYGELGHPVLDLMITKDEQQPLPGKKVLCCHPFEANKRTYVTPTDVETLHHLVWDGEIKADNRALKDIREYSMEKVRMLRKDHLRALNPTPYKVSLSEKLFDFSHAMWKREAPVREIR